MVLIVRGHKIRKVVKSLAAHEEERLIQARGVS